MTGVGFTDFYDASTARQIAMGGGASMAAILEEINAIKTGIDTGAAAGALSFTLTNDSTMTSSSVYYNAWANPAQYQDDADKLARARMDAVVTYFSRLGYTISRQREDTENRFEWVVKW